MKPKTISILSIFIFSIILLLCIAVLGLWIFWYLTNHRFYLSLADFIRADLLNPQRRIAIFVIGICFIFLIITGIVLLFARLIRQVEKNKIHDDFMNTVSHELKTPLSSIQLSIETLLRKGIPDEKKADFFNIIASDTERLSFLIETIIETAQLEDKRKIFNPEYIIADETITRISNDLISNNKIEKPELIITGSASCLIHFDVRYLRIILNNLLDNSIKFGLEPIVINITYETKKNHFIMYFSDNGIGIPPKKRKLVFRKFIRLSPAEKANVQGTGLGLYYVHKIVKAFNGSISIVGDGDIQGTTFRLRLPISSRTES